MHVVPRARCSPAPEQPAEHETWMQTITVHADFSRLAQFLKPHPGTVTSGCCLEHGTGPHPSDHGCAGHLLLQAAQATPREVQPHSSSLSAALRGFRVRIQG